MVTTYDVTHARTTPRETHARPATAYARSLPTSRFSTTNTRPPSPRHDCCTSRVARSAPASRATVAPRLPPARVARASGLAPVRPRRVTPVARSRRAGARRLAPQRSRHGFPPARVGMGIASCDGHPPVVIPAPKGERRDEHVCREKHQRDAMCCSPGSLVAMATVFFMFRPRPTLHATACFIDAHRNLHVVRSIYGAWIARPPSWRHRFCRAVR